MINECWNTPNGTEAGKGDKPRPVNGAAYRAGFDAINWSRVPRASMRKEYARSKGNQLTFPTDLRE